MAKLIWKITGYLGDKSIYERVVRRGALSQKAMVTLLRRLASRMTVTITLLWKFVGITAAEMLS